MSQLRHRSEYKTDLAPSVRATFPFLDFLIRAPALQYHNQSCQIEKCISKLITDYISSMRCSFDWVTLVDRQNARKRFPKKCCRESGLTITIAAAAAAESEEETTLPVRDFGYCRSAWRWGGSFLDHKTHWQNGGTLHLTPIDLM